jgi:HK97 family phage prohead protease
MKTLETRTVTVNDWEMRESGDGMSFAGYAAVFNSESQPLPFVETIAPGAFSRTLQARNNVRMLLNHNPEKVLGATRSGTLRLSEDGHGLRADATLPPTSVGRDLSVLMQRGDVDSMSFGFTVPAGGDTWTDNGAKRELREINLFEVSVVTFPAYEATSAQVRAVDVLAERTGEDASELALALTALESGTELTRDQAALLSTVVGKLSPAEPEPEPVADQGDVVAALDLLRAQLDLAYKAI